MFNWGRGRDEKGKTNDTAPALLLFVGDSEAGGFVYLIDGFIQQSLEYPELLVGIRYHANLLLQLLNSEIRRFSSVLPPRAQLKEPDCVGRTEVTYFIKVIGSEVLFQFLEQGDDLFRKLNGSRAFTVRIEYFLDPSDTTNTTRPIDYIFVRNLPVKECFRGRFKLPICFLDF